jgi:hypothetical protein
MIEEQEEQTHAPTVESWAKKKKSDPFLVAAARGLKGWVPTSEVSEADFDKALQDAGNVQLGDRSKPAPEGAE